MLIEILEFIFYSSLIVIISKYFLVTLLRKLAENLNLKAHSIGKIAGIGTDRFDVSSEQAAYCRFAFIFIDFY